MLISLTTLLATLSSIFIAWLSAEEGLLLQLRFDQELSFDEIARLTGLGGSQRAHRHIAAILKKLHCTCYLARSLPVLRTSHAVSDTCVLYCT